MRYQHEISNLQIIIIIIIIIIIYHETSFSCADTAVVCTGSHACIHKFDDILGPTTPFLRRIGSRTEEMTQQLPLGPSSLYKVAVQTPTQNMVVVVTKTKQLVQQQQQTTNYNLGIGKNPPVYGKSSKFNANNPIDVRESTTQYWIEHEATREYPSPQLLVEASLSRPHQSLSSSSSLSTPQSASTKRSPPLSTVQPKRRSQDALHIQHPRTSTTASTRDAATGFQPAAVVLLPSIHRTSNAQLDVNTVWVEMMLHNEQMKAMQL